MVRSIPVLREEARDEVEFKASAQELRKALF